MRKNTVILASAALLLGGCCAQPEGPRCGEFVFSASLEEGPADVKSGGRGIWKDSVFAVCVSASPLGPATRAGAASAVPDVIGVFGYRYLPPWTGGEGPGLLCNCPARRSLEGWVSDSPVLTGEEGTPLRMRFYAYAPFGAEGLEVSAPGGEPVLEYTVPEDVERQTDLLYGESGENLTLTAHSNLHFRHILSAVAFEVDDCCSSCTVKSVTLRGIHCSASRVEGEWTDYSETGSRGITTDVEISEGGACALTSDSSTLMLIPPDAALRRRSGNRGGEGRRTVLPECGRRGL